MESVTWLDKMEKLINSLARIWGTDEFISISKAHISGVSYKTAGDHMIELLEDIAESGVRVRVNATLNPAGMDLKYWSEMGIPKDFAEKQIRLVRAYEKLGIKLSLTCAPYFAANPPKLGETVAFSESSAVIIANSLLGARTNRHGNLEALAAAIIGRVPKAGMLLDENRVPTVKVFVEQDFPNEDYYGLLGIILGEKLSSDDVPLFFFKKQPLFNQLRLLGAALAASGSLALFHVAGVTPEAIKNRNFQQELSDIEKITIELNELEEARERFFQEPERIDLIAIGCPHASFREIVVISKLLKGKKIRDDIRFWIFTSRVVRNSLEKRGILKELEKKNVHVFADTCMVVAPIESLGVKGVLTNSSKAAWYIPKFSKGEIRVGIWSIEKILLEFSERI